MMVAELIDLFGGPAPLGAEIGAKANTVATWKKRNRIPAEWWVRIAGAAARRGFGHVTLESLAAARPARAAATTPTAAEAA